MADELRIFERPSLERPVLITAFRGWNDGGQGASLAGGYLARAWDATRFAEIDPEEFYDFQATRPHVSLEEGLTRRIDWPENAFYYTRVPGTDRDAVLLLGIEPNLRWRTFSDLVVGLATELQVELAVTMGSLLADVPHTRPSPVTGERQRSAPDRGARPAAVALRGPDGDRRHAPRRLPPGRDRVGLDLGGRPALRLARARARARRSRSATSSASCSAPRSTRPSCRRPRTSTPSR